MKFFTKISLNNILVAGLLSLILLSSCSDADNSTNTPVNTEVNTTFAVVSDCHYYSSSLGTSGAAFEEYIANDRKLIAESQAINESVFNTLKNESFNFLIICGDLTKDGEKVCHQDFAKLLADLEKTGKKVYVIPGNHDVRNPESFSYNGDKTTSIPSVTATEFASIYNDFGYGEAIAKDPNSLSYVVEPSPGLWLIAMDPCRYKENTSSSITGGKFSTETLNWINTQLQNAKAQNKTVIGTQHHGLVEHFTGQKTNPISAEYVIDDWQSIAANFASLGMQAVFTGHYHANDISKYTSATNSIYDIETGSLVTSPCPYRIISMKNNQFEIATKKIETINYNTAGKTFQEYAYNYTKNGMIALAAKLLQYSFGVPQAQAEQLAPFVAGAFVAHYAGDELMPAETQALINSLMQKNDQSSLFLAQSLKSLYTDLNPSDNNVTLPFLKTNISSKLAVNLKD